MCVQRESERERERERADRERELARRELREQCAARGLDYSTCVDKVSESPVRAAYPSHLSERLSESPVRATYPSHLSGWCVSSGPERLACVSGSRTRAVCPSHKSEAAPDGYLKLGPSRRPESPFRVAVSEAATAARSPAMGPSRHTRARRRPASRLRTGSWRGGGGLSESPSPPRPSRRRRRRGGGGGGPAGRSPFPLGYKLSRGF